MNRFQYLEDLVDHLVANLNEQKGTQYPLMDEIGDDSQTEGGGGISGKLFSFTKFAITALATQSALNYMTPMAQAATTSGLRDLTNAGRALAPPLTRLQKNYPFFANYTPQISVPDNDSPYSLRNKCGETGFGMAFDTTGVKKPKLLRNNSTITGGYIACLSKMKHSSLTLAIPKSDREIVFPSAPAMALVI